MQVNAHTRLSDGNLMTLDSSELGIAPPSSVPLRSETGEYLFDLGTGSWWWSDETYRMHGFEPGEVVPTTAMVLAHKHPADRDRVRRVLDGAADTGAPFQSIHRIVDAHGAERAIILVGTGERGPDGSVVRLVGCFVDVSAAVRTAAARQADESIRASAESRSTIEQAKGVVSATLDVDPDTAFQILRNGSNATNVPLRDLAAWLLPFARALMRDGTLGARDVAAFLRDPYPPRDGGHPRSVRSSHDPDVIGGTIRP